MTENNQNMDALLDTAIKQLRDMPVDEQNLDAAMLNTRHALHQRIQADGHVVRAQSMDQNRWRRIMNHRGTTMAAAAAIIIVFIGIASWLKLNNGKSGIAFADVIHRISSARTVTFTLTIEQNGQLTPSMKAMELMPGRRRIESPDGSIMILDVPANKGLILMTATKQAVKLNGIPSANEAPGQNFFDRLLKLRGATSEELGQRNIDGKPASGFYLKDLGIDWTIWVDLNTGLPLHIEAESNLGFPSDMKLLMHDFAFDVPLDESLFSLESPSDYATVDQQFDIGKTPEDGLIKSLRLCTEILDGHFPEKFDMDSAKEIVKRRKAAFPNETEMQRGRWFAPLFVGFFFVQQLPAESDWHYAGSGVMLGQTEVPICWWKPAQSQTYRVVFGDLSVVDMEKSELDRLIAR